MLQKRSSTPAITWSNEALHEYYGEYPDHIYQDVTPDDESRPITDAQDYLALINKALVSAHKDDLYLWNEVEATLGLKALKWIGRALHTVYRHPNHVAHEINYYNEKMERLQDEQSFNRAQRKRDDWQAVGTLPKQYDVIARIKSIESLYQYEIDRLHSQLTMERRDEVSAYQIDETEKKLNRAMRAKFLGSSASTTFDEAIDMLKLELIQFEREQSVDQAVKVLAWLQKVRTL